MFKVLTFFIVIYCVLILYVRRSDSGDGKKKNIAGWMLFGLMWPQMKQQIEKDPKQSENVFTSMLIMFLTAALVVVYLIGHGKLSF